MEGERGNMKTRKKNEKNEMKKNNIKIKNE